MISLGLGIDEDMETAGEETTAEASAEDMPPLEGEEGDDPSKMEEVD